MGGEPTENSKPRPCSEDSGVHWWGEMRVFPEAVVEKVQAQLTPENMEEVHGLAGIWKFRGTFVEFGPGKHP